MKKKNLVRFGLLIVSIVTVILVSRVSRTGGDPAPQTTGNGVGQLPTISPVERWITRKSVSRTIEGRSSL
jgi:hypothetical protein